ncbi:MAG TPA: tyrosine-type recombinase/integrase [Miltoncostaeaceae bacterium]|nr:tyrosine-type recombinase/integrase [Miltoncostaeaceae bacterium]
MLPALTDDEYAALKADIREHGILYPLIVDEDGRILDGVHRARIAAELHPPDDRLPGAAAFPGFTVDVARNAMTRACRAAGIRHFHPHDLRHRRLSLWHHQGLPAAALAARAGHARASMSLDVYSHVLVDDADVWSR